MKILIIIAFLFLANLTFSQDIIKVQKDSISENILIYEPMPEYPGGNSELKRFLSKTIIYPDSAKENGVKGSVWVQYTIDTTGKVIDVKVTRGIGYGCDEEAIRIIKLMPNWIPAKRNGKAIKVRMSIAINFNVR